MTTYIIRRLLMVPLLLFGVTILIFGMLQFLSPAERASLYVRDIPRSVNQLEIVIKQYDLDDPIYIQYWNWLKRIVKLDFGESFATDHRPVGDKIKERMPVTIGINVLSMVIIFLVAIPIGVSSAVRQYSMYDKVTRYACDLET